MMLKALLKKQFLELNQFYFQNRKTGKARSRGGVIGTVLLYVLLLGGLALTFGVFAASMGTVLFEQGLDWVYFAMFSLLSVFLGVFGGVFNTYATFYKAKDNELLLAMPIPPGKILFARMAGIYVMGLMYEVLVFLPTIVVYWLLAEVSAAAVVFQIVLLFLLGLLVLTLVCLLGWVVALISDKIKNKSLITVLASLIFFGVYYVCYFRLYGYLSQISAHAQELGGIMQTKLYPFYVLGLAASGRVLPMAAVSAVILVLFALTYWILSRSFYQIVTANHGEKKTVYHETQVKTACVSTALWQKELRRFLASPTYMLNCGLGIVIMPLAAVAALIKMQDVRALAQSLFASLPNTSGMIPVIVCGLMLLLTAMVDITAPSISLEGKSLWLVQSLPVDPMEVLTAKLKLHEYLCFVPAVLCTAALCFVFEIPFYTAVLIAVTVCLFVMLSAQLGLMLNLKNPNLTWTNETAPVKQSMSVMVVLLGGMLVGIAVIVAYYFLAAKLEADMYLIVLLVGFTLLNRLLNRWLRTKGSVIFKNL